ncbi:hypothetical protein PDESU_00957 [Pontiella desulfatans]|uniref:Uncharacterized protein n=1 Tax=Pontiella desulfatans TaxID=2750659 RepID=A0A6C2TXP4_PONDE|nr:hypothetical protein [Pontiella desulfatans]VGO12405.1 hypothetical protein PDESU_00957 [Pontiella desulfatans]
MSKVVIKTADGMYVGGGKETELVDRITRAYVYEDGPDVDTQISIVNAVYGWQWKKVDAEQEYDRQLAGAGP